MKKIFSLLLIAFVLEINALPQRYGSSPQKKCRTITKVEYDEVYVPDCKTTYRKKCDTLYRNKCNDYQDEVCQTVQKRHCDQQRKKECRTEYKTVSQPYTDKECKKVPKCEKTWQQDGYGNKVWKEDKSNCVYEDECYDVQKHKQVKEPYEECEWKTYEDCYNKPEKSCKYVTKQRCNKEPYEECKDVPHEVCKQIHKQVPREVKKKVCDDHDDYDYDDVHGNGGSYTASDVGNAFVGNKNSGIDIRNGSPSSQHDDDKIHFG